MFEVYRHEFELDKVKYSIIPASGEHLGLLYSLLSKLQEGEASKLNLDEEYTGKLYKYTVEVFKKSYPQENIEKLEAFCSQNLFRLFEHVVQVSMRKN
jgi:hypothetical protein